MTEAEWLISANPRAMLKFWHPQIGDRKRRLFVCALCRRLGIRLADPRSQRAVEVAESFSDYEATEEELGEAFQEALNAQLGRRSATISTAELASSIACTAVRSPLDLAYGTAILLTPGAAREIMKHTVNRKAEAQHQANLLRCVVGNPFSPTLAECPWLTDNIRAMGQTIYENRCYEDLPILADALEDAGCDNADILNHLRGPGAHCRGCWALDLILGKE